MYNINKPLFKFSQSNELVRNIISYLTGIWDEFIRQKSYIDSSIRELSNKLKTEIESIKKRTRDGHEDLSFDPTKSGGPPSQKPDDVTIDNVFYKEFTSSNNQCCGDTGVIPHSFLLGEKLYPHINCFLKDGESAGTTGVTFRIYWCIRNSTDKQDGYFDLTASSQELTDNAYNLDIFDSETYIPETKIVEMSSKLSLSIHRTGGDAGDIIVTTYGVYYKKDSYGSRTILEK